MSVPVDIINVISVEAPATVHYTVEGSQMIQDGLHWKQALDCWTIHTSVNVTKPTNARLSTNLRYSW